MKTDQIFLSQTNTKIFIFFPYRLSFDLQSFQYTCNSYLQILEVITRGNSSFFQQIYEDFSSILKLNFPLYLNWQFIAIDLVTMY